MNDSLIDNWNEVVGHDDEVYVLGDLIFGNPAVAIMLLNRLNGKIFFVRGNHDKTSLSNKVKGRFEWIKDYFELRVRVDGKEHQISMFHYPIAEWNKKHHGAVHFHGHSHGNCKPIGRRMDVGVDSNNYTPVLIEDAVRELLKIEIYTK